MKTNGNDADTGKKVEGPDNEPFFKCCQCGCEELDVIRHFVRSTFTEVTVPCGCGEAEVAAMRLESP